MAIIMLWICLGVITLNSLILGMVLCKLSTSPTIELTIEHQDKE